MAQAGGNSAWQYVVSRTSISRCSSPGDCFLTSGALSLETVTSINPTILAAKIPDTLYGITRSALVAYTGAEIASTGSAPQGFRCHIKLHLSRSSWLAASLEASPRPDLDARVSDIYKPRARLPFLRLT